MPASVRSKSDELLALASRGTKTVTPTEYAEEMKRIVERLLLLTDAGSGSGSSIEDQDNITEAQMENALRVFPELLLEDKQCLLRCNDDSPPWKVDFYSTRSATSCRADRRGKAANRGIVAVVVVDHRVLFLPPAPAATGSVAAAAVDHQVLFLPPPPAANRQLRARPQPSSSPITIPMARENRREAPTNGGDQSARRKRIRNWNESRVTKHRRPQPPPPRRLHLPSVQVFVVVRRLCPERSCSIGISSQRLSKKKKKATKTVDLTSVDSTVVAKQHRRRRDRGRREKKKRNKNKASNRKSNGSKKAKKSRAVAVSTTGPQQ